MPAEKRSPENQNDEASSQFEPKLRRCDVLVEEQALDEQVKNYDEQSHRETPPPVNHQLRRGSQEPKLEDDPILEEDSDSSHTEEPPEFAYVDLQTIRKEVQCPICLGIIKKTRTVMECLHRFCRECIDKSMRMGNNECPACRTHCASRRSLRDDPRYDDLIASLYPDIKKFEEEELAFYEEDEARNKQIQESITQVLVKQAEALGKKRPANKNTAGPSVATSQRKNPISQPRRRRRRRNSSIEYQDSDDNDDAHDSDSQLSPNEHHRELKPRKAKSRGNIVASHSGEMFENIVEQHKEERGLSFAMTTCGTERLCWGRGGVRSNTRHGNVNDGMSGNDRRVRLAKLVDFIRNVEKNDDESIAALKTPIKEERVQLMGMRDGNGLHDQKFMLQASSCNNSMQSQNVVDQLLHDRLHRLDREETHPGVAIATCISNGEQLILAYPQKEAM